VTIIDGQSKEKICLCHFVFNMFDIFASVTRCFFLPLEMHVLFAILNIPSSLYPFYNTSVLLLHYSVESVQAAGGEITDFITP